MSIVYQILYQISPAIYTINLHLDTYFSLFKLTSMEPLSIRESSSTIYGLCNWQVVVYRNNPVYRRDAVLCIEQY